MTGNATAGRDQDRPGSVRGQRLWGIGCALLGLAALGAAAGLGVVLSGQVEAERAYRAAGPCAAGAAGGTDCLRTVRATVESAEEVRSGKARQFRVRLRPPAPAPLDRPLDLEPAGELSRVLGPGDAVEVTVWRDLRVSARHAGLSEDVDPLPEGDVGPLAGLAAACVWLAGVAFVGAYGGERRARDTARGRVPRARVRFGPARICGVLAVPLLVGFVAGGVWDGWAAVAATAAGSALVAVQATVFVLRADR
ncbi:hypothetical protein AB0E83_21780 [Streptomyces sp. NPDC035033]|uniref:hypothetical protein n=1 Tax=Streptomyces sp. NPDC035033 TaxID=3155368 RepID=UPI0033D9E22B